MSGIRPLFSIIVVSLNAGEELIKTINSVLRQNIDQYEIIIKDGFSKDGSIDQLPKHPAIRLFQEKDKSIYDAMNQAIRYSNGEYFLFLNCGDYLYDESTLRKVAEFIQQKGQDKLDIVYGNLYNRKLDTVIYASSVINDFTCFRNVPCHQTCFYHRHLFEERGYHIEYTVRADYEHFLWCYFVKKATIRYIETIIAEYEGGGFSETKENRIKSAKQHDEIIHKYMKNTQILKYKMIMLLTLAPLRRMIAENETASKWYNALKTRIYRLKK